MAKYRKKPVVVEAEQFFDGKPCQGVYGGFPHQRRCIACLPEKNYEVFGPAVVTIHGQVTPIVEGDWIIDEGDGLHFYPCKPDIFEATYEPCEWYASRSYIADWHDEQVPSKTS